MKYLLDTHLLLWTAEGSRRLPARARSILLDPDNELIFSAASIWETAIKNAKDLPGFDVEPDLLRSSLLANLFTELPISGRHASTVASLPAIHQDPFDRILVAQALVEGFTLLTADATIARYPGPIRKV
jgi:PIN domain nuclease of toxin-antitoxin system